jgi:hypothetical protein
MTELQNRLRDKAFSKMHTLNIEIRDLETDLRLLSSDLMQYDMTKAILAGAKRDLELWNYIAELVEKDI